MKYLRTDSLAYEFVGSFALVFFLSYSFNLKLLNVLGNISYYVIIFGLLFLIYLNNERYLNITLNPILSLLLFVIGKINKTKLISDILFQLIGCLFAVCLLKSFTSNNDLETINQINLKNKTIFGFNNKISPDEYYYAFCIETAGSAVICLVFLIFNFKLFKKTNLYAFIMSLLYTILIFLFENISGASFNILRCIGNYAITKNTLNYLESANILVYIISNFVGIFFIGIIAKLFFFGITYSKVEDDNHDNANELTSKSATNKDTLIHDKIDKLSNLKKHKNISDINFNKKDYDKDLKINKFKSDDINLNNSKLEINKSNSDIKDSKKSNYNIKERNNKNNNSEYVNDNV